MLRDTSEAKLDPGPAVAGLTSFQGREWSARDGWDDEREEERGPGSGPYGSFGFPAHSPLRSPLSTQIHRHVIMPMIGPRLALILHPHIEPRWTPEPRHHCRASR